MPTERLRRVPTRIVAGDSLELTLALPSFRASDGGQLVFRLAHDASPLLAVGVPNGDAWDVTIDATDTESIPAGSYQWSVRVTEGAIVRTVMSGIVTVSADLADGAPSDRLQYLNDQIALVDAAITQLVTTGAQYTMVGDRQFGALQLPHLRAWRAELAAERSALLNTMGGVGVPIRYTYTGIA